MRRRRGGGIAPPAGADLGPSLRLGQDGRLRPWGGAVAVVVESRDDPGVVDHRQTVRGARRENGLAELLARKIITKRMFDAAERFLDDCSIASGGTACALTGMPPVHGARDGLPVRQVNAITRVNAVRAMLETVGGSVLKAETVFWWVVFGNGMLRDYEAQHRVRNGKAGEMLRAALGALDHYYHAGRS